MSYRRFVGITQETGELVMDYARAAHKVIFDSSPNRKLYNTFRILMNKGVDELFNEQDVIDFLKDIYRLRISSDSALDIFMYNEKENKFKITRKYFRRVCEYLIENITNPEYNVYFGSNFNTLTVRGLKFDGNNRKFQVTIVMGDGSEANNKGTDYEYLFFNDCEEYISGGNHDILTNADKILEQVLGEDEPIDAKMTGTKDKNRFEHFAEEISRNGQDVMHTTQIAPCGKKIADITISTESNNDIYLSLKKINGARFANIGIRKCVNLEKNELSESTIDFLDTFYLDAEEVKRILVEDYKDENDSDRNKKGYVPKIIDLKNEKSENEYNRFKEFMAFFVQYSLGYGYWLVKENKDTAVNIDKELSEKFRKYLVSDNGIKNIIIKYPKQTSKQAYVVLQMGNNSKEDISLVFKNSYGGRFFNRINVECMNLYEILERISADINESEELAYTFDDVVLFDPTSADEHSSSETFDFQF